MTKKYPSVRLFGNPQKYNGYGHAIQNISKAFSESAIPTEFIFSGTNKGYVDELISDGKNSKIDLYIQTPPFNRHRSSNYKVGYFYWEADLLPKVWAKDIQKSLDEVWVPCELTKQSCLRSGFKKRIEILPTPAPLSKESSKVQFSGFNENIAISEDTFKFYSIFQWNERKGYKKLLRAYFEEFSKKDNVVLILKVNPINHKLHGLGKIKKDILKSRSSILKKQSDFPKIFLITENLSNKDLSSIHHTCDAFVLPHHGEGWGMPIHDAVNHQNFIITTQFGGITEWLNSKNSFIINHSKSSVFEMNWNPWYSSYQSWANPSLSDLKHKMRSCYSDRKLFAYKKKNLEELHKTFSVKQCSLNLEKILSKERFRKFI